MNITNYRGKGEHSVNELELIIKQQAEELHLFNSGSKQFTLSVVEDGALNDDQGHGICKEDGCKDFAVIDYNGHGHWNCRICYDRNERYFEEEYG